MANYKKFTIIVLTPANVNQAYREARKLSITIY